MTVDSGPAALLNSGFAVANELYATVTICTPGSTTACQTIDHVQVDTGSYGFSVIASVLSTAVPKPSTVNGGALRECVQYADGYTWGSMATVDVTIGQRKIASLPVDVIGDPAAGTAPADCSTGAGPAINTVTTFYANGVIGIGYFAQDCGQYCVDNVVPAQYYSCPSTGCVATAVPLALQQTNPISVLTTDNNGALITLPSASANGQATLSGTLYFGVGTNAHNGVGSGISFLTVEPSTSTTAQPATLVTQFLGTALAGSVVDSGSNAYYFNDSSLTACTSSYDMGFFCSNASLNATLQGVNGKTGPVTFDVGDAGTLFASNAVDAVFPTLAGVNASVGNAIPGFDWGLPFFYGRPVYVLFEGSTAGSVTGPAVGF